MTESRDAEVARVRKDIRDWIAAGLPEQWSGIGALGADDAVSFVGEWRARLQKAGLLAPAWPVEYGGGGRTPAEAVVIAEELSRSGVPAGGPNDAFGIRLLGNTVLQWGTEEQKRRILPRVLSGEDVWCQGYSEPGAGSDLAGLRCRAEPDGSGGWTLTGQKTWTTNAHLANWIFVLARTDTTLPRHKGISFVLCRLDQPGVQINRIPMMSGDQEFSEVFFDGARVEPQDVVGPVNGGWSVAMTLVGHERGSAAATRPFAYMVEMERLIKLAQECRRSDDPVVRQKIARSYTKVQILRYMGMQAMARIVSGHAPGPEASINKLYWSEHHREVAELAIEILGPGALVFEGRRPHSTLGPDDPGAPNSSSSWMNVFLNAQADTIYQGTSDIQRNTLAERVLGLPR